mgnify:FL=1|jgi:hypothetical protein
MGGITLAQAEAKLTLWMDAEDKVAAGQSYSIAGRQLSRASLGEIRTQIEFWERKVNRLSKTGGGMPVKGVSLI